VRKHMDVIGHHAPGKQFLTLTGKMQQGVFHEPGNARVTQMTLAVATIEIFLQFRAFLPLILNS